MPQGYTTKYAHLKEPSKLKVGDKLDYYSIIGICGDTGQSHGRHLHIDLVEGRHDKIWRLSDMVKRVVNPDPVQLCYFIDKDIFLTDQFVITSYYYDPAYYRVIGKHHPAFDIISLENDKQIIHWNRSKTGTVTAVGHDVGYGNYVLIYYEV